MQVIIKMEFRIFLTQLNTTEGMRAETGAFI